MVERAHAAARPTRNMTSPAQALRPVEFLFMSSDQARYFFPVRRKITVRLSRLPSKAFLYSAKLPWKSEGGVVKETEFRS